MARTRADLARLLADKGWSEPGAAARSVRPWTDDYANPLGAIWRELRN